MFRLIALRLILRDTPAGEAIAESRLNEIMRPILSDPLSAFNCVVLVKRLASSETKSLPPKIVPGFTPGTILINGRSISKQVLIGGYRNLLAEAEDCMSGLLLGHSSALDESSVYDNPRESTRIQPSTDPNVCEVYKQVLICAVTGNAIVDAYHSSRAKGTKLSTFTTVESLVSVTGASTAWTVRGSKSSRSAKGGVRGLWHDGADCCSCCLKMTRVARTSAGKEASSEMSRADRERARAPIEEEEEGIIS